MLVCRNTDEQELEIEDTRSDYLAKTVGALDTGNADLNRESGDGKDAEQLPSSGPIADAQDPLQALQPNCEKLAAVDTMPVIAAAGSVSQMSDVHALPQHHPLAPISYLGASTGYPSQPAPYYPPPCYPPQYHNQPPSSHPHPYHQHPIS